MNLLIPFNFNDQSVRVITSEDGEPLFVAKDVAEILEYSDTFEMTKKLDDDEIQNLQIAGFGNRGANIINESGLWSSVLRSIKPQAKAFKKWVTSEVLPSIRKTGSYSLKPAYEIPQTYAEALRLAADTQELLDKSEAQRELDKPKVDFAMAVRNLDGLCSVGEFAKIIGTGRNRLFVMFRDDGFLMRNNEPYQPGIDRGLFKRVELKPFKDSSGTSHPTFKTMITGKGQVYFEKRYRKYFKEAA